MCSLQESDKHQQQEYRVGRRKNGAADYAASGMCVRGEAHLEFWVILRFDLFIPTKHAVSQQFTSGARRPTNPP